MSEDTAFLAEIPFFQLLDEKERADLLSQLEPVSIPAGRMVFDYGDPGDALFIVRSGTVEVFFKDDTGQRIVLETGKDGYMFGELSLLDSGPRTASVLVVEDLEALKFDRQHLASFLQQRPSAALDLLAATGRRLRFTVERLRHTASRNVNEEVEDKRTTVMKVADWIAEFSGSIPFLLLHAALFFFWIVLNTEWIKGLTMLRPITNFDPFPYGLLTMAVSLEAIFLSVFVLLSQNRQAAKDHVRSDIEYDVNLKAELEIGHLHEKVDRLQSDALARLERIERQLTRKP
jgi:CRP/FNR family transcriptional regulator, cyclic AMP receptor protein